MSEGLQYGWSSIFHIFNFFNIPLRSKTQSEEREVRSESEFSLKMEKNSLPELLNSHKSGFDVGVLLSFGGDGA